MEGLYIVFIVIAVILNIAKIAAGKKNGTNQSGGTGRNKKSGDKQESAGFRRSQGKTEGKQNGMQGADHLPDMELKAGSNMIILNGKKLSLKEADKYFCR